jgi:hypothetical protein
MRETALFAWARQGPNILRRVLAWTRVGPLRFPGNPSCAFAPVQDPGRTDDPSPMTVSSMLPLPFRQQRLQRLSYRGYRGASAPAVYASRMMLPPPMQDSLPAGWLAFAGRELNPLDCDERFPSGYILFLLSWIYPDATKADEWAMAKLMRWTGAPGDRQKVDGGSPSR